MINLQNVDGLSECIGRAIQDHVARLNINSAWPQLNNFDHPILRVEAFLEEADANHATRAQSERIASRTVDLAGMRTPAPTTPVDPNDNDESDSIDESYSRDEPGPSEQQSRETRRKGTGGLRVSQNQSSFQEDLTEHQRQMQVDSGSFPKRKKVCQLSSATSFFPSPASVSLEE